MGEGGFALRAGGANTSHPIFRQLRLLRTPAGFRRLLRNYPASGFGANTRLRTMANQLGVYTYDPDLEDEPEHVRKFFDRFALGEQGKIRKALNEAAAFARESDGNRVTVECLWLEETSGSRNRRVFTGYEEAPNHPERRTYYLIMLGARVPV